MRSMQVGFDGPGQASDLLARLRGDLGAVISGEFWKLDGNTLLDLARDLEQVARLVWAAQVHLTDEIDQQHLASTRGATSTAALLREVLLISPGQAAARVRAAKALLAQDLPSGGEQPIRHPALAHALDTGRLPAAAADLTLRMFRRLPDTVPADTLASAEAMLVEQAATSDPVVYRRILDHLETVLHPDGPEPGDPAVTGKAELTIGNRNRTTGLTPIHGHLDDHGITTLRSVLHALGAPTPTIDGIRDDRAPATRNAHALTSALTWILDHGADALPDTGRERPHITITLDWDTLHHRARTARVDNDPISPATTRRLLCDAAILPAVLNGAGQVLDVGRSRRTFPTAIRRAIALRDRGCIWPGCDRPVTWCDTHHINWWHRDLGPTSYTNGALLCAVHHTKIHHDTGPDGQPAWTITLAPDGTPELIPPPWIDPTRRPRRNPLHHVAPHFLHAPPGRVPPSRVPPSASPDRQ